MRWFQEGRLLDLPTSKTAGKMPALPQHAAASVRQHSQPVCHQLEKGRKFELHVHAGLTPLARKRRVPLLRFVAFGLEWARRRRSIESPSRANMRSSRSDPRRARRTRWIQGLSACLILCAVALCQTQRTSTSATPDNIITFDAPGAGKNAGQGTSPQAINDGGEIAGYYKDASSVLHGFVRHKDGTFSTFDAPGASKKATLGTFPQSINKNGEV